MATFQAGGHDWKVSYSWGLLNRISKEIGVDLTKLLTSEHTLVDVLFSEPEKLVGALYMTCEAQAKDRSVSPEAFGEMLDGEVLESAMLAILDGVIDFFPKARGREAIKRALRKALTGMATTAERVIDDSASKLLSSV